MKKIISILLIFFILANLTGCEGLRKKFTRKKKPPVKMPRIYQVKKYEKKPTPELYKKHYAYWMSWQSEMVKALGQNHKKDIRCIEEITANLKDMQNMLIQEKAEKLKTHIDKLEKVKNIVLNEELTQFNKTYVKQTLESEDRLIKREFVFDKVKGYLKKNFESESEK